MSGYTAPLIDVFYELRRRNFPLGVAEYLLILQALDKGFGTGSREELKFMCQTIWAKSTDEQIAVADALDAVLPRQMSDVELEALSHHTQAPREQSPLPNTISEPPSSLPEPPGGASSPTRNSQAPLDRPSVPQRPAAPKFTKGAGATGTAAFPEFEKWEFHPNLEFVGDLPVTRRQMKRAWRYFRRMRRIGIPLELDIAATIEQTYRFGVFLGPVLIPRRTNLARMLILKDEGGSMIPFQRVTRPLLDSARHSSLSTVSILFFHDIPGNSLFRDASLNDSVPFEEALAPFSDGGVLIISDGGAARGNYNQHRVEQTSRFLQKLGRFSPNVSWLNPTPPERWLGTSADAIRRNAPVSMFTFDRAGLDAAVDVLRGRC
jgi:uncharacterized protein with von Willebrand factor type A (vWA) domain